MSLIERLETDLTEAMKTNQPLKRDVLRLLKSAIKNAAITAGTELTDEAVVKVIQKEVKNRRESIDSYTQVGKPELAEAERQEAAILEAYLPAQMSEADVAQAIETFLAAQPNASMNQMGQLMGQLSAELKDQADLGLVSRLLKEKLSS